MEPNKTIVVNNYLVSSVPLLTLVVGLMLLWLVQGAFSLGVDDSDCDGWHRSGVAVVTDHRTGLQYLRSPDGGITPRLDATGKQIVVAIDR